VSPPKDLIHDLRLEYLHQKYKKRYAYKIAPKQHYSFIILLGGYHGKFGGIFVSTASQHGGIETTALTALTFFAHQGIIFVPLGYAKCFAELCTLTEVIGASPYGAGTLAGGDGSRQPSVCLLSLPFPFI
jgi:multimeric flavodoxin WrbA